MLADDAAGKAALVRTVRTRQNYESTALMIDRFLNIKASPEAWAQIESEPFGREKSFTLVFCNLTNTISDIANNMGWGDIRDVESKSRWDSPLVAGMLDSWNGKISITVDLTAKLDLKFANKTVDNLENVFSPLGQATSFKPRGGKAFVTLKVDPAASKPIVNVSKDGNTYLVAIPAYATFSQYDLAAGFKKGQ